MTGIATYENIEKVIVQPAEEGMSDAMATSVNAVTSGQVPALPQVALGGSYEPPNASGDGIVDGTNAGDTIDVSYVDGYGDQIDNGDALLPVEGPDDDIVLAGGGNDDIFGGDGADLLSCGKGRGAIDLGSDDNIDLAVSGDDQDTFNGIGENDGGDEGNDFSTRSI